MKNTSALLAAAWRIAALYFRSDDKWAGRGLLLGVIVIELTLVVIDVLINQWNNRFYNALQERNLDMFIRELWIFAALAGSSVALQVYQIYVRQWLQIRARQWLTKRYLDNWLNGNIHYRMQITGEVADNPDQRIAEDVDKFVELGLVIGLRFLSATVTLVTFVVILWSLSQAAPLSLFGYDIPGYLVWVALIYAVVGTVFTHLIGRPLIGLNFEKQKFEADFRFNLVRTRENSEQIALLKGETAERAGHMRRFAHVVSNWWSIMRRQKKLTAFRASYDQTAVILPYIVASPAYFAGKTQLGGLMQTASAFGSVQGALSVLITIYGSWAEWQSVIARLDGFETAIAEAESMATRSEAVTLEPAADADAITIRDLALRLPDGKPLVTASGLTLRGDDSVLLTGPSGSGKSTLFRAIAGIWPFGRGDIRIPAQARLMMLPQRPYFPVGALAAAIAYPAEITAFDDATLRSVLSDVGLPALAERLDEQGHWNRTLSLGEQQRLGVARALLHKPDYLFLDEATASLDEPAEAAMYRLLAQRLPRTAVVSIGHRSTLVEFHKRRVAIAAKDGGNSLSEATAR